MKLLIRRPNEKDVLALHAFFDLVITDAYIKNGIMHLTKDYEEEKEDKREHLKWDLESKGKERFFQIGIIDEKIVACIEYGKSNDAILEVTENKLKDVFEIGTVYVHPDYQGKKLVNQMIEAILIEMKSKGIESFCFDSGFKIAQKIWKKKFGEPKFVGKDYWDKDADNLVWYLNVDKGLACIKKDKF